MKKNLILLVIFLLTFYFGFAKISSGLYNTDFKEMTITQNGNKVTGTYKHLNGRIEGTLSGHILTGFWCKDSGKGKMIFEFNSDFSKFAGKWGYNYAVTASKWNGKRIGVGQAYTPTQQSTGQPVPPYMPKTASNVPAASFMKLNVKLNNTDTVADNINKNAIQLNVSKRTFDQQVKLQVKESESAVRFDQKRATLIGTPFDITIDQKSKRLNKPVIVKLKLEKNEIASLKRPSDLWIGYFNVKNRDYFPPLEVNIQEGYVKFETYHLSEYNKAELTKIEQINDFSFKSAVNQWAGNDNNALTKQATEQLVSEILRKKWDSTIRVSLKILLKQL